MRTANEREMLELERIRYVTENYERLQGLRKLPVAILLLALVAALAAASTWIPENLVVPAVYVYAVLAFIAALFIGAWSLYHQISNYYQARYGSVEPFARVPIRRKVLNGAIVLALVLSTSFGLLLLGIAVLAAYWPERRFRKHYVVMGAFMAGYGLLHITTLIVSLALMPGLLDAALKLYEYGRLITFSTIGTYLFIGGIFDHRLLVRNMKVVPEEDDGRAV